MTEEEARNNIMSKSPIMKTFRSRRVSSMIPFARTPTAKSLGGKFHDYHLSINPYETTVYEESVIAGMLYNARIKDQLKEDASEDEQLEHMLNKITKFKVDSQRYN